MDELKIDELRIDELKINKLGLEGKPGQVGVVAQLE